jgi:hypothetical protein
LNAGRVIALSSKRSVDVINICDDLKSINDYQYFFSMRLIQ